MYKARRAAGRPAADLSASPMRTTVAIEGSHTRQRRGLAPIQRAQFRQQRQQHDGRQASHADHRTESGDFLRQRGLGLDQGGDPRGELFQVSIQLAEVALDLQAGVGVGEMLQAVVLGHAQRQDLLATGDQLRQLTLGGAQRGGPGPGVRRRRKPPARRHPVGQSWPADRWRGRSRARDAR